MDWWKVAAAGANGYAATGSPIGQIGSAITGSLLNQRKKKRRPNDPRSKPSDLPSEYSEDYMPAVEEEEDEY